MDEKKKKTKAKEEGNPYQARVDFEQMEEELCKLLGRYLKKAIKSGNFEAYMKSHRKKFLMEATALIKRFTGKAQRDARSILNATYEASTYAEAKRAYANAGKPDKAVKVIFGGQNESKLKALEDELTYSEREASVSILRAIDDKYKRITADAMKLYTGGDMDLEHAVQAGTEDLRKHGIRAVPYKDGRKVNAASYIEMAARTANQRAKFYGEGAFRGEIGNYLVIVSSHISTCELCAPWQGKILIDDVFSGPVPDSVMIKYAGKYATVSKAIEAGAFHPNCRHQLSTWYEGISQKGAKTGTAEQRKAYYKAEVKQRAIEREIRADKRAWALATNSRDRAEATEELKKTQAKMAKHLKENPQLKEIDWREKVYS